MGGHGGLNILPQKRWNVYGRENRLKVSRDEAKHAEEEKVLHDRQQQVNEIIRAEREHRRALLLKRAHERGGRQDVTGLTRPVAHAEEAEEPKQHFSLFGAFAAEENPEVVGEKRQADQHRGNKDTHTSDPKFDASFKFAHTVGGPKPWYAASTLLLDEPAQDRAAPRLPAPSGSRMQQPEEPICSAAAELEKSSKHRHSKHHRHRRKDKGKDASKSDKLKSSMLQQMREERKQREATERSRELGLMRSSVPADAARPLGGKKYHSAFSHGRG